MKNKKITMKGVLLALLVVFVSGLFSQNEANAYFKTSKDGKTQCFAVQYTLYEKHNNPVTGTTAAITKARKYSTEQVCANVDKNGKITGSLTKKSVPDGYSKMNHPKLTIGSTFVHLYTCPANGVWCGGSKEIETSFDANKFDTFEALAQAVTDAAPATYNNNKDAKKASLKDNKTTQDLEEEAKKEDKQMEQDAVDGKPSNNLDKCRTGGSKALGWVVCPILEWIGNSSESIYDEYIEPSLQIEPQLFTGGNDAVKQAWGIFRDIANVVFVILLLVVIFSQLTGVGIDNYGIKRVLPKLIMAAVLINLSYFICLMLVDVSNILGNSFQAMFNGMGEALTTDISNEVVIKTSEASGTISQEAITTGLASVGLLGAIVGSAAAIFASPAILLSVFVSAIGILISIFFLFILLSARQAAIIVLVVISPIAVVLYTLPNTKKYFDKCWKLFEGLLFVYPICGLLVGAGDYISKLLIAVGLNGNETDFIWVFTAMITGIVPILFIPKVLQDAFAAMGNLGAKITGLGRSLGSGATGAIRGSGAYRNLQSASDMRKARILGGITKTRDKDGNITYGTTKGVGRGLTNLFAGGAGSRRRYAHQYRRMVDEQGSLSAADESGFMDPTLDKMAKEQLVASGMINNIGMKKEDGKVTIDENGLTAALIKALRENNHSNIREITNALSAKGDSGRDAVKYAWNTAIGPDGNGVSKSAAAAFGNNIMANHAVDYKNNARSMFETAKAAQDGVVGNSESVSSGKLAMGVKANTIATMDDSELSQTFGPGSNWVESVKQQAIAEGKDAEAAVHAVRRQAYMAIQNNPDMKAGRYAEVSKVAEGYTPDPADYLQVRVG